MMRAADLRALAQRTGLSFLPSALPGRVGELNGILRGHRVLVRPDRPALYVEYRFRVAGLQLSTRRPPARQGRPVETGHAAFERTFPWRAAQGATGDALRGAAAFHGRAAALARQWRGVWAALEFDGVQLCMTLRRRRLWRRVRLSTAALEGLLFSLIEVVEALEAALREHALRVAAGAPPAGRP
jgi:hypothetical protein